MRALRTLHAMFASRRLNAFDACRRKKSDVVTKDNYNDVVYDWLNGDDFHSGVPSMAPIVSVERNTGTMHNLADSRAAIARTVESDPRTVSSIRKRVSAIDLYTDRTTLALLSVYRTTIGPSARCERIMATSYRIPITASRRCRRRPHTHTHSHMRAPHTTHDPKQQREPAAVRCYRLIWSTG